MRFLLALTGVSLILCCGGGFVLQSAVTTNTTTSVTPDPTGAFIVGFPLIILAVAVLVWALVSTRRQRDSYIYVFDHGYVHARRTGAVAYRWDAVETILQSSTVQRVRGMPLGVRYRVTITFTDGRTAKLTSLTTTMARFAPVLQANVRDAQLPGVLARVRAGEPVAFGRYTVGQDSLTIGRGQPIPWPEVSKFGRLLLPGAGSSTKNIPNLYTFLAVTDQAIAERGIH
jgi:hypothetical protein